MSERELTDQEIEALAGVNINDFWAKAIPDATQVMSDRLRYGFNAIGPDGKRIDPTQLTPRESSVKAPVSPSEEEVDQVAKAIGGEAAFAKLLRAINGHMDSGERELCSEQLARAAINAMKGHGDA